MLPLESTLVQAFAQLIVNFAALVALSLILYRQNMQLTQRMDAQRTAHEAARDRIEEKHRAERDEANARMVEALADIQNAINMNARAIETNTDALRTMMVQHVGGGIDQTSSTRRRTGLGG